MVRTRVPQLVLEDLSYGRAESAAAAGWRGGDIKVSKHGNTWILDVGVVCPGTQRYDDHPWNPQARTTTETVLREAMQALGRVQAHMLARIVVEIRAADIAVELEP